MPDKVEPPQADRKRREEFGTTTCAACLADSVGLCTIHERDLTNTG